MGVRHAMIRPVFVVAAILMVALIVIPTSVVYFLPKEKVAEQPSKVTLASEVEKVQENEPTIEVPVYRTGSKKIEKIPLEHYVRGVIASEMPSDFELEALKAQAMAARTYIVRRLVEKDFTDTPKGSIVTDTVKHQVFRSEEELRQQWGLEYDRKISKINQAVNETMGQVLTYEGRPINATFFSTSNGYTENSEDYWGTVLPYLRSVESPWDVESPRFKEQIVMSLPEFEKKLGVKLAVPTITGESFNKMITQTVGKRVKEIKIGEKNFSGKEIRELLGLSSSDFTWKVKNGKVYIDTVGWGHGVGMSQWGANGMAKEGKTAQDIVHHYYHGIKIEDYRQWIVKK